jgi:ABC-type Fe3+/spermidine/putrescine transport system ATPase subunit
LADELLILDRGHVLQAGRVADVFARPASELVARLLGATNIAEGTVVGTNHIDIGDGVQLSVTGPTLRPGARVGWAVGPDSIIITPDGSYPATITQAGGSVGGRRDCTLKLGNCRLQAALDAGQATGHGACRVSIDGSAVQVWMLQDAPAQAADQPVESVSRLPCRPS